VERESQNDSARVRSRDTAGRGRGDRTLEVNDFILDNVQEHPRDILRLTGQRFGFSRQMANRYADSLVAAGLLDARGKTRARQYTLRPIVETCHTIRLTTDVAEDAVWRQYIAPHLSSIPLNVLRICQYGFTEMFNNAIEHSEASRARIALTLDASNVRMMVFDYGIGLLNKLARDLNVTDGRVALNQLLKGKLTTAPERHSGEGIFFTSRVFDDFALHAGRFVFRCRDELREYELDDSKDYVARGTTVSMKIALRSERILSSVFSRFTLPETNAFDRTHVLVKLSAYSDEGLVSRSQARRIVSRLPEFKDVTLDFQGIEYIGQAFADEVFRVFANSHPAISLRPVNANADVSLMIRRAQSRGGVEHRGLAGAGNQQVEDSRNPA